MKRLQTSELIPGMVTAEDVFNYNGQMILPKGLVLTDRAITRLEFYSILSVRIEDATQDVAIPLPAAPEEDLSKSEIIRSSQEFKEFRIHFDQGISDFRNSINDIVEKNAVVDTKELLSDALSLLEYAKKSFGVFDMLHNMRQYDDLTYAHSMNVALICNVFAGWLKWSTEETELLTLCGLLHDIGKLKIPDAIIKKPAKLTDYEYNVVKTHTLEGYNILKKQNVDVHIINSALMHHEKCDATGYPLGLSADKIDRFAKAVSIVDVYDAMTSARIYRGPLCPFRVIELFESEGLQKYDAHYIMTFLENVVNTYLHTEVRLSNGSEGRIVFINRQNLSKPIVQCGTQMIDLSTEHSIHIDMIL